VRAAGLAYLGGVILLGLLILAGEAIRFDAQSRPQFTPKQIEASAASTRAGLERWAATAEGKAILARFQSEEREVVIVESADEPSIGRAPAPGFLTLLATTDPKKRKSYDLILNPTLAAQYDYGSEMNLGLPRTPADVMALAWAGEMLHIDFYASGIALPHHERGDFQGRWQRVIDSLGLPRAQHATDSLDAPAIAPRDRDQRQSRGQIYRVP